VHWPQLLRHTLCTTAAPHPSLQSSVGLQLQQIAAAGTEKALLADVMEAHPDASYVELLRLFKVCCSIVDGHSFRAWCIVSASRCLRASQLPHLALCSVPRCLVVRLLFCLCVCVCLRLAFAKHTVAGAAYAARASSRGNGPFALCCAGVRCACTGAPPPTPPSRAAQAHCVCVEYPRRGECCAISESSPRTSRHADRPCCM
jgi:hypothetical protein